MRSAPRIAGSGGDGLGGIGPAGQGWEELGSGGRGCGVRFRGVGGGGVEESRGRRARAVTYRCFCDLVLEVCGKLLLSCLEDLVRA